MSTEETTLDDTTDDEQDRDVSMTDQSPDPAEISDDELEAQDWQLGGELKEEIVEALGMQWRMLEPGDEDEVNRLISPGGGTDRMRQWFDTIIQAPEITDDRFEDMKPRERILLLDKCMSFFGFDDFVDQEAMLNAIESGELEQAMAESRNPENRGGE